MPGCATGIFGWGVPCPAYGNQDGVLHSMGPEGLKFGERVFVEGEAAASELFQALPTASDECFAALNICRVEQSFVHRTGDEDWIEIGGDDELGLDRIAADVPFGSRHQLPRRDFPDDEP